MLTTGAAAATAWASSKSLSLSPPAAIQSKTSSLARQRQLEDRHALGDALKIAEHVGRVAAAGLIVVRDDDYDSAREKAVKFGLPFAGPHRVARGNAADLAQGLDAFFSLDDEHDLILGI